MKIVDCNYELDQVRQYCNKIQEKMQMINKQSESEDESVMELKKKLDEQLLQNDIFQEQIRGLQLSNQDLVMAIKILKDIQDSQTIRIEIQTLIEKSQFNQQKSNDYKVKEIFKQKIEASKKIEKFKTIVNDLKSQFNNFDVEVREAIFNLKKQHKYDMGEQEKLILEQKIKMKNQSDQIFTLNKELQEQKRKLDHNIEDARQECRRKIIDEFESKVKEYQKQLNEQNDYSAEKMKDLYNQLNNTKNQLQKAGQELENINNQNSKLRMNGQQLIVFQNQLKRTEQQLEDVEQHRNHLIDENEKLNELNIQRIKDIEIWKAKCQAQNYTSQKIDEIRNKIEEQKLIIMEQKEQNISLQSEKNRMEVMRKQQQFNLDSKIQELNQAYELINELKNELQRVSDNHKQEISMIKQTQKLKQYENQLPNQQQYQSNLPKLNENFESNQYESQKSKQNVRDLKFFNSENSLLQQL